MSLVPQLAAISRPVLSPSDGRLLGTAPDRTPEEVQKMVESVRAAQPGWNALGFAGRARLFRKSSRWLLQHRDQVIASIVAENGKVPEEALIEIVYCASAFSYWGKHASALLRRTKIRSRSPFLLGRRMFFDREPVGVVGVIGPWNNPLTNSFGDAIPALAAGNTVVLKPSELTPLTALLMEEMLRECGYPADVYRVASGGGETGRAVVDQVDFIMFTGSTRTGKQIAAQAAERLIPVALELGGKDALLVLDDADIHRAANVAVHGALFNSGQTCTSVERVYVESARYDEFVNAVVQAIGHIRQGEAGSYGASDITMMTSPAQLAIVEEQIESAVAGGARILAGGHRVTGREDAIEPTVLVDVDATMACMVQETFGPTLPIMRVASAGEAIAHINASPYGLQASIMTSNISRGIEIAGQLEVGNVTINDTQANYLAFGLPMGGWKQSGIGVRHGADGIRKFTRAKSYFIASHPKARDLHMMPFNPASYRLLDKLADLIYGKGLKALLKGSRSAFFLPRTHASAASTGNLDTQINRP